MSGNDGTKDLIAAGSPIRRERAPAAAFAAAVVPLGPIWGPLEGPLPALASGRARRWSVAGRLAAEDRPAPFAPEPTLVAATIVCAMRSFWGLRPLSAEFLD